MAFGFGAVVAFAVSARRTGKAEVDARAQERLPKYFDYVHELEETSPRQNGKSDTDVKTAAEQEAEVESGRAGGLTPWYNATGPSGGESLAAAYEQCREITERYSKTFYLATALMSRERGQAFWAVYAWCRRTDDLVDMPRQKGDNNLEEELIEWEARLNEVFAGRPRDVIDAALTDTVMKLPNLSIVPFEDMIKGMVMDVPGT